jgi:hypothetical protein
MAHNGGTPRLLAKCGSAVEVLDEQQIKDPALARVKRARTTGHTDSELDVFAIEPGPMAVRAIEDGSPQARRPDPPVASDRGLRSRRQLMVAGVPRIWSVLVGAAASGQLR